VLSGSAAAISQAGDVSRLTHGQAHCVRNTPSQCRILTVLPGTNDGMNGCADCTADVDHCHGTLVAHGDGSVDCTDAGCGGADPLRHVLIIECVTVLGGCCQEPAEEDLAQAS
jgi:hypothetical protein